MKLEQRDIQKKDIQELLEQAYAEATKSEYKGKTANYIPLLQQEDVNRAAAAFIDEAGVVYTVGEHDYKFSLQSIAKIFIYLLVLDNYELEDIQKSVGVKPSSKPYNSLLDLEMSEGKVPVNPFINAGALSSCSLLLQKFGDKAFDKVLELARKMVGNSDLNYSEEIYLSAKATAFANRAIVYTLLKNKIIPAETSVDDLLDLYIKTCVIMVDTVELARMGQTLSKDGINHLGERAVNEESARIMRAIMAVAGTYDYSGDFAISIGLPAKSGIGGGIVAATRDGYGFAVYSPGLDQYANPYVGLLMMEFVARELDLSIY